MRKNASPKKTARNWDEAFTSSQYPLLFAYLNLAHIPAAKFRFPCFSYFHQISQKIRSDLRNTHNSLSKVLGDTVGKRKKLD
jgi:hypothetical protein